MESVIDTFLTNFSCPSTLATSLPLWASEKESIPSHPVPAAWDGSFRAAAAGKKGGKVNSSSSTENEETEVPEGWGSSSFPFSISPHTQRNHPYNILPHHTTSYTRRKTSTIDKKKEKRKETRSSVDPATMAYCPRPDVMLEGKEERFGRRQKGQRMKEKVFLHRRIQEEDRKEEVEHGKAPKRKERRSPTERGCGTHLTEDSAITAASTAAYAILPANHGKRTPFFPSSCHTSAGALLSAHDEGIASPPLDSVPYAPYDHPLRTPHEPNEKEEEEDEHRKRMEIQSSHDRAPNRAQHRTQSSTPFPEGGPHSLSTATTRAENETAKNARRCRSSMGDPTFLFSSFLPHRLSVFGVPMHSTTKTGRMKSLSDTWHERGCVSHPSGGGDRRPRRRRTHSTPLPSREHEWKETDRKERVYRRPPPPPPVEETNDRGVGESRNPTRRRRSSGTAVSAVTSSSSSFSCSTSASMQHRIEVYQALLAKRTKEVEQLRKENQRLRGTFALLSQVSPPPPLRSSTISPTPTAVPHAEAEGCIGSVRHGMAKSDTRDESASGFSSSSSSSSSSFSFSSSASFSSSSENLLLTQQPTERRNEKTKRSHTKGQTRNDTARNAFREYSTTTHHRSAAFLMPHSEHPRHPKASFHPVGEAYGTTTTTTTTSSSLPLWSSSSAFHVASPSHAHVTHSLPSHPSRHSRVAPNVFLTPTPSGIKEETKERTKKREAVATHGGGGGRPRRLENEAPPHTDAVQPYSPTTMPPVYHSLSPYPPSDEVDPVSMAAAVVSSFSSPSRYRKKDSAYRGTAKVEASMGTGQKSWKQQGERKTKKKKDEDNEETFWSSSSGPSLSAAAAATAALAGIHHRAPPNLVQTEDTTTATGPAFSNLSTHTRCLRRSKQHPLDTSPKCPHGDAFEEMKKEEGRRPRSTQHQRKIPRQHTAGMGEGKNTRSWTRSSYPIVRNTRTNANKDHNDRTTAEGERWGPLAAVYAPSPPHLRHGSGDADRRRHGGSPHRRASSSSSSSSFLSSSSSTTSSFSSSFSSSTVLSIAASLLQWYQQIEGVLPARRDRPHEGEGERLPTTIEANKAAIESNKREERKNVTTRSIRKRKSLEPPPPPLSGKEEGIPRSLFRPPPPSHDEKKKRSPPLSFLSVPFLGHRSYTTTSLLQREMRRRRRRKKNKKNQQNVLQAGGKPTCPLERTRTEMESSLASHSHSYCPSWKEEATMDNTTKDAEKTTLVRDHASASASAAAAAPAPPSAVPENDGSRTPSTMPSPTVGNGEDECEVEAKNASPHRRLHSSGVDGSPHPQRHSQEEEKKTDRTPPPPPPTALSSSSSFYSSSFLSLSPTVPSIEDGREELCSRAEPQVGSGKNPSRPPPFAPSSASSSSSSFSSTSRSLLLSSTPRRRRRTTCSMGHSSNRETIDTPEEYQKDVLSNALPPCTSSALEAVQGKENLHHEEEPKERTKEKNVHEPSDLHDTTHRLPTPLPPAFSSSSSATTVATSPSFLLSPLPPPLPCTWEEKESEREGHLSPATTSTTALSVFSAQVDVPSTLAVPPFPTDSHHSSSSTRVSGCASSSFFSPLSLPSSTVKYSEKDAVQPIYGTLAAAADVEARTKPEGPSPSTPTTTITEKKKDLVPEEEDDEAAAYRQWKIELDKKLRLAVKSKRVKAAGADKKDPLISSS